MKTLEELINILEDKYPNGETDAEDVPLDLNALYCLKESKYSRKLLMDMGIKMFVSFVGYNGKIPVVSIGDDLYDKRGGVV